MMKAALLHVECVVDSQVLKDGPEAVTKYVRRKLANQLADFIVDKLLDSPDTVRIWEDWAMDATMFGVSMYLFTPKQFQQIVKLKPFKKEHL